MWLFRRGRLEGATAQKLLTGGTLPPSLASEPPPGVMTGARSMYEELAQIGKGGMGEVLLARDRVLRRTVALKRAIPDAQGNAPNLGAFLAEAQITAQLDHPGIMPVYGFTTDGAYAMKLVHGETLDAFLWNTRIACDEGRPLDDRQDREARLDVFLKVCDAVAFAHERGVIHRDIKPENIMVGQFGEVLVLDWGVAMFSRRAPDDVRDDPTATGVPVVGTPAYM